MVLLKFCSRVFSIGALCGMVFIAGCTVQGPAGPTGPQGPPGPQGPAGPAGASARVANITVAANQWVANGVNAPGAYLQSGWINSSIISADIINSGIILAYNQVNDASQPVIWQQLPLTLYYSGVFTVVDFQYRSGQVQFFINSSGTNAPARPTDALVYRIVAISGTTTAELKQQNIDVSSYAAVKQAFHITE